MNQASSRPAVRMWALFLATILLAWGVILPQPLVRADSPPNLTSDLAKWESGFGGVADVETWFNYARRQEESQLGLATSSLGNLDLPSQAVWNTYSDDAKALHIMNAERQARAGMKPGVIGLPFTAVQINVDNLAQWYANYLVAKGPKGAWGHNEDGRTPWKRIQDDPVLGPCHEGIAYAENLAAFFTSGASNPLHIERAIYGWLYVDKAHNWGHREMVLLQDKSLLGPQYKGFTNNVGSPSDEGFIGIGVVHSTNYDPFDWGYNMGTLVVMEMIDPISTGTCPWDLPTPAPTVSSIAPSSGQNTGTVSITNLAGGNFQSGATVKLTKSGQTPIPATGVNVVSASKITCQFNLAGAATGAWNVVVTNLDAKSGQLTNGFTVTAPAGGPTVSSIVPNSGLNTGTVSITNLAGGGFQAGATVKLSKSGQSDIQATGVSVVSASKITCQFNLTGAATGVWNVVVRNPDAKSGQLTNGFAVTAPSGFPTVSSITPNSGQNTGTVQITNLAGGNFQSGATVSLTRSGYAPLNATNVNVVSASKITCQFNLSGLAPGKWGVTVTNPGLLGGTLPNGFTVTAPGPPPGAERIYMPLVVNRWPPATEDVFSAISDTSIRQGFPNGYFGAEDLLLAGYDPDGCWGGKISRGLVGFDLDRIPRGATVQKATLHLELVSSCDHGPSTGPIAAFRIRDDWDPNAVTWNSRPGFAEAPVGQVTISTRDHRRYSMDVTGMLQGWANRSFNNYGIMIRGPESSGGSSAVVGFATRNYQTGAMSPRIEVTYTATTSAAGPAPAASTGIGPEAAEPGLTPPAGALPNPLPGVHTVPDEE